VAVQGPGRLRAYQQFDFWRRSVLGIHFEKYFCCALNCDTLNTALQAMFSRCEKKRKRDDANAPRENPRMLKSTKSCEKKFSTVWCNLFLFIMFE
jgi:hypothetical protein